MKSQPQPATQEVLAGPVERVTFHNADSGFAHPCPRESDCSRQSGLCRSRRAGSIRAIAPRVAPL